MEVAGTLTGNLSDMGRSLQPSSYLNITYYNDYDYSITVIYKGLEMHFSKILSVFTMIDLSSNLFEGKILEVIGDLKGLWGRNLSNLTGHIPSSLGKLKALESVDLSRNKLRTDSQETNRTRLSFHSQPVLQQSHWDYSHRKTVRYISKHLI